MARVSVGARLHFGFQNLSLAGERLYGGVGAAVDSPRIVLEADRASETVCADGAVRPYLEQAVDHLDLPGARVRVEERFARHVGLGSGTQIALATLAAVARAYDYEVNVRESAPALGRGGRSGVGVGTFERGGFVVDGGHPTQLFTAAPPAPGTWEVPPIVARHPLPEEWRFVLVIPEGLSGESGEEEDAKMRSAVERAGPGIAGEIAELITGELLPAAATGDIDTFGSAIARLGRLNGAWYADEQGGLYRPPAGTVIDRLAPVPEVAGAGQSSWGPTVYALTWSGALDTVIGAARDGLDAAGVDGEVRVVAPRNEGAAVVD